MRTKKQVLVVDDCPDLRSSLVELLNPAGIEAIQASSGRAALNTLRQTVPDVVCLDVCLPETSGYELVEHMRNDPRLKNVPVLMMSGRMLPNEVAFAEEAGADLFLPKPFTGPKFLSFVERLLSSRDGKKEGDK